MRIVRKNIRKSSENPKTSNIFFKVLENPEKFEKNPENPRKSEQIFENSVLKSGL